MCEDQRPFLWQQLVLLHSELLQELTSSHRKDGLEQAAAKHLSGFIAREAVVTLWNVAVAQPPAGHGQKHHEVLQNVYILKYSALRANTAHTLCSLLCMPCHRLSACAGDTATASPASSN